MDNIIYNLSNEEYHHGEPYSEYISSSILKLYKVSPLYARYQMENPQEQTKAMEFGSLFHDVMEYCAKCAKTEMLGFALSSWKESRVACFAAPVNEKTGQPYGAATKAYKEAYDAFLASNAGKIVASAEDIDKVLNMAHTLLLNNDICALLKAGKPEVSVFYETEEGVKLKVRPDIMGKRTIVDWKTTSESDLSEESVNRIISRYSYDISAAMYQDVIFRATGQHKDFLLVLVTKEPPYDFVMVDMRYWAYDHDPNTDVTMANVGARRYQNLLKTHADCLAKGEWPGASCKILPDESGHRVLCPMPSQWEEMKDYDYSI